MPIVPIANLSPEILAEIFIFIVTEPLVIPPRSSDTLWSVAQTCSQWRSITTGFPRLWNRLNIEFPRRGHQNTIHCASECLRRSQDSSLSVQIALRTRRKYGEDPSIPIPVPDFLAPHTPRIRSLSITFLTDLSSLIFPNLQYLHFDVFDFRRYTDFDALIAGSGRSIIRLTGWYPFMGADWCRLLEWMPSLEELWTVNPLPPETIQQILVKGLCPVLRSIRCGMYNEALDTLLDMLASRSAIKDVSIECLHFKPDREEWERIYSLRDQGVRVEVLEPPLNEYDMTQNYGQEQNKLYI